MSRKGGGEESAFFTRGGQTKLRGVQSYLMSLHSLPAIISYLHLLHQPPPQLLRPVISRKPQEVLGELLEVLRADEPPDPKEVKALLDSSPDVVMEQDVATKETPLNAYCGHLTLPLVREMMDNSARDLHAI